MYDRRDLVRVYLAAQERGFGGYRPDSSAYNAALKVHYTAMLDGLQRLFGLRLHEDAVDSLTHRVRFRLFSSTADSFFALRTPWSRFLEAGLLIRKIEEAGAEGERVMAASRRIDALTAESRESHLEMLDALVAMMLGDRAELTFSPADLRAIGVDDTEPNTTDHPLYEG
jgi:hypothetical protein